MECRQQSTNHCHSKPVSDFPNADMFSRLLPGRPMSEKSDVWDCPDLLAKMEKRSLILALIRSCQCYVPAREWAILRGLSVPWPTPRHVFAGPVGNRVLHLDPEMIDLDRRQAGESLMMGSQERQALRCIVA